MSLLIMASSQPPEFDVDDDTVVKDDSRVEEPKMYKVILNNDDYTPMEFVIETLVEIFHKNHGEATQIMLQVHNRGKGICGIYTYEIAETKVSRVHELAEKYEYPLRASIEEA